MMTDSTELCDSMTVRLLDLATEHHGRPPVAFAWLALGSCARGELTLASDQDNALAYEDPDDPAVLRPLTRVSLHEAIKTVAAAQRQLP
jgi:signal-transduction protein with cAMP-binding, CBS, and nucleotidyltransferase domain